MLQEEQVGKIRETVRKEQAEILFRYGSELRASGNLERALDLFEDFLILYGDHTRAFDVHIAIAEIHQSMKQYDGAISHFELAREMFPEQERGIEAYLKMGRVYAEIGESERARTIFNEIAASRPFTRLAKLASMELSLLRFVALPVSVSVPPATQTETSKTVPGSDESPLQLDSRGNPLDRMGEGVEKNGPKTQSDRGKVENGPEKK